MFIRDDGQIFKIKPNPERLEVEGNFKAIEGISKSYKWCCKAQIFAWL